MTRASILIGAILIILALPAPTLAAEGKTVYEKTCATCHNAGLAGAPRLGDQSAWQARIKQGTDVLYQSALNGKGVMPPKGGNASLSEEEVKAAVDYMVSQAQ